MTYKYRLFLILFIFLTHCTVHHTKTSNRNRIGVLSIPQSCLQLVVVTAPNEASITATMRRYTRTPNTAWQKISEHPVTIGRTGLAWGTGLHDSALETNTNIHQHKRESDGKSPAGIFSFGAAFGYAPTDSIKLHLPYHHVSAVTQCIESGNSNYYNTILQRDTVITPDWGEEGDWMRRKDNLYQWGVFVNHNTPAEPFGGSCIFFHIWRGPDKHTAGCTAMTEENIFALINWLNPADNPVLVQLTDADYIDWKARFALPDL